jgi:hypothetical protein
LIDTSLIITLGVIFALTLIGAYMRSTVKDRCLKSLEGFQVTLEMANGKTIWGIMHVASSGIELQYPDAVQDEEHLESSYILYASEFQSVQAIYRYAYQLDEEMRVRRQQDIERSFHPRPLRRLYRKFRNFMLTATSSLNDMMNVVVGRAKVASGGQGAISRLSGEMLGLVGIEFDAILEKFIGQRVVMELVEDGVLHEHVGIFQDYSLQFLLLLDVRYPRKEAVKIKTSSSIMKSKVSVEESDGALTISNRCEFPILLHSLTAGQEEQLINAVIGGEESAVVYPKVSLDDALLNFRTVQEVDMIVPRSRAMIRHRAERFKEETMKEIMYDVIFDVGVVFSADKKLTIHEERLRAMLELDPDDPLAAANLGSIMIQKGEYPEAVQWLKTALAHDYLLPDGGRRARMELREIERKQATPAGAETSMENTAGGSASTLTTASAGS